MLDFENTDRQFQVYLLVAVALALNTWDVSFNLGVYGTIFFEKVFTIWVVSTTTILAYWLLDDSRVSLHWLVQVALLAPTATMILFALDNILPPEIIAETVVLIIYLVVLVVTLPITLYVVLVVTIPDIMTMRSNRKIAGLAGVVILIAAVGLAVGANHRLFLTCEDFKVSGNDVPADCRVESTELENIFYP